MLPRCGTVIAIVSVFMFAATVEAEQVTITVASVVDHVFEGLGMSMSPNTGKLYTDFPKDVRDSMTTLTWQRAGFTFLRVWVNLEQDVAGFRASFARTFADALAKKNDLMIVAGPTAGHTPITQLSDWGATLEERYVYYTTEVARRIRLFKDSLGVTFHYTGVANEPNDSFFGDEPNGSGKRGERFIAIVKHLRRALDDQGLQNVKIFGPECSNVDWVTYEMIQAINGDPEALGMLDGYAFHSYTMSATRALRDMTHGKAKTLWQTESSGTDMGSPARLISDLNLGTTHWCHFLGYSAYDTTPSQRVTRFMWYKDGSLEVFRKYYNLQLITNAFHPGTRMRFCTASFSGENEKYMVNTYKHRAPVVAMAGVNPEGRWALAAQVQYCADHSWQSYYDVQFSVQELAGEGSLQFDAYRATASAVTPLSAATMSAGKLNVRVKRDELYVFESRDVLGDVGVNPRPRAASSAPHSQARSYDLYSLRGRLVARGLTMDANQAGIAGRMPLPHGCYVAAGQGASGVFRIGHLLP